MMHFHYSFDFLKGQVIDLPENPLTEEEIYLYTKYVVLSSKMEREIPVMALVYVERLLTKTSTLLNQWNWRRIVLICLILASKIWDDESLENIHFPKVMADLSILEVNELEKTYLDLTNYELYIKGSEYAKYYFILKTF